MEQIEKLSNKKIQTFEKDELFHCWVYCKLRSPLLLLIQVHTRKEGTWQ